MLTPNDDEVEFNNFIPDYLVLKVFEFERYFIGDSRSSDINNFNILIIGLFGNNNNKNR